MYKARDPGIPILQHMRFLRELVCTRQASETFIHQTFTEHLLHVKHSPRCWDTVVNKIDKKILLSWGLSCGRSGARAQGVGGSRGSGRRARGAVCIAPEAHHVSPPRGSPGWLALRQCHLESWLFSHLRLFIIVGASIEMSYTSGTEPCFGGVYSPPFTYEETEVQQG